LSQPRAPDRLVVTTRRSGAASTAARDAVPAVPRDAVSAVSAVPRDAVSAAARDAAPAVPRDAVSAVPANDIEVASMSSGHLPEFVAEGVRYACRGSRMPRTRVCGYVAYREESDCSKQEDGNSLDYFPVHDQSFTYKSIKRTFPTFRQSVNTGVPRLSRCRRGRCRRQEHQSAIKRVKVSDLEPRVQLFSE
jgi:hypothetical protein